MNSFHNYIILEVESGGRTHYVGLVQGMDENWPEFSGASEALSRALTRGGAYIKIHEFGICNGRDLREYLGRLNREAGSSGRMSERELCRVQ